MKCKCGKDMNLKKEDVSKNKDGKEYVREVYCCEECDIWITVETPRGR
jgi:hypothetical protein